MDPTTTLSADTSQTTTNKTWTPLSRRNKSTTTNASEHPTIGSERSTKTSTTEENQLLQWQERCETSDIPTSSMRYSMPITTSSWTTTSSKQSESSASGRSKSTSSTTLKPGKTSCTPEQTASTTEMIVLTDEAPLSPGYHLETPTYTTLDTTPTKTWWCTILSPHGSQPSSPSGGQESSKPSGTNSPNLSANAYPTTDSNDGTRLTTGSTIKTWAEWWETQLNLLPSWEQEEAQWMPLEVLEDLAKMDDETTAAIINEATLARIAAANSLIDLNLDTPVDNLNHSPTTSSNDPTIITTEIHPMTVMMQTSEIEGVEEEVVAAKPKKQKDYYGWRRQKAIGHWAYGTKKEIRSYLRWAAKHMTKDKEVARDVGKLIAECRLASDMALGILGRYRRELGVKSFSLYQNDSIDQMQDGLTCRKIHRTSNVKLKELRKSRHERN
jgi:hypothetical protein